MTHTSETCYKFTCTRNLHVRHAFLHKFFPAQISCIKQNTQYYQYVQVFTRNCQSASLTKTAGGIEWAKRAERCGECLPPTGGWTLGQARGCAPPRFF